MVAVTPKTPVKRTVAKPVVATNAAAVNKTTTAGPSGAGNKNNANKNPKLEPTGTLRRKELVERVVARSGLKPNQVKSVLDPLFQELGNALSAGEMLNLQPFGKITVNRQKVMDDREILNCKIRRNKGAKPSMV